MQKLTLEVWLSIVEKDAGERAQKDEKRYRRDGNQTVSEVQERSGKKQGLLPHRV